MEKIKKIYYKYEKIILYIFFGGLTTLINILGYYLLYQVMGLPNMLSNLIALVISILFAYVTNKTKVFKSKRNSYRELFKEIGLFYSARALTGAMDMLIMFIGIDLLGFNYMVIKIISNIVVIVSNYILSNVIIFKNDEVSNG